MCIYIHHCWQRTNHLLQHIIADDYERNACRGEVLLRTTIDKCILRNINRASENIRAHIGNNRNRRVNIHKVLCTVNCVICTDIEVVEVGRNLKILWNVAEVSILRCCNNLHLTIEFSLLNSLLCPYAGVYITRLLAQEVCRNVEELGTCTTANKVDMVVIWNRKQLTHQLLCRIKHLLKLLCSMRNREDRKTCTVKVKNCLCCILIGYIRKNRWACAKIMLFHNN